MLNEKAIEKILSIIFLNHEREHASKLKASCINIGNPCNSRKNHRQNLLDTRVKTSQCNEQRINKQKERIFGVILGTEKLTRPGSCWKHWTPSTSFLPPAAFLHYSSVCTVCRTLASEQCPGFYLWFHLPSLQAFAGNLHKGTNKYKKLLKNRLQKIST